MTNCCIADCQYALFVSSHQGYLFLSYCGILKHINSLQHIFVLHFVKIQHPLFYVDLLLFYWDQHAAWQDQGFPPHHYKACTLYNCLYELDSCTHYMGNYMKTTLSIRNISFHVQLIWLINISHCRIGSISVAGNRPLYKTTLQFKKKVPIYNSLLLRCNYSKVQLKNPSCKKGI